MEHIHKGRTWIEVGREPYTRKDGTHTELTIWHTKCAKCDAMVEVTTPAGGVEKSKAFEAQHCNAHKLTRSEVFDRRRTAFKARKLADSQPGADLV